MGFYDKEVETLSRPELERLQLAGVQRLIERVYRDSPFYHERLAAAGIKPGSIRSLAEFREKVPFLSKEDLLRDQEQAPPFGRRLPVAPEEVRQVHMTSGSSGQGQEVYALTANDVQLAGHCFSFGLSAMELAPGDTSALLWPVATMPGGLAAAEGMRTYGLNGMILGIYNTEMKLNLMRRFNVQHLWATPAYLSRLAVVAADMAIDPRRDLPRLKAIMLSTESFPPDWVQRMEDFWGCTVYDCYGTSQIGALYAYNCEVGAAPGGQRGAYHLEEWLAYVEVLKPETGEPAAWGEEGEPIITTFQREGGPLLRFRQGDKVRLLAPGCACDRTSARWETGAISRYDDMIKMKAVNVWPAAIDEIVFAFPEIDEYNGRVSIDEQGRERTRIRLEWRSGVGDEVSRSGVLQRLPALLREKVGIGFDIEAVPPGTIERFEYKARRWTDERVQGLQRITYGEKR